MQRPVFYTAGSSGALDHARNILQQWGQMVSPIPSCHVTHLLLPVPSFDSPRQLKGGQTLHDVLGHLPENITIFGGNLPPLPYRAVDFLQDEFYLQENAQITARCAMELIDVPLAGASVLVIGWGRIGKQLLSLLKQAGAEVTFAVRRKESLDQLQQMGERAALTENWQPEKYDLIVNTAPAPLLDEKETKPAAQLMDLASVRGISGDRVLWARGLPGKMAPEASGQLIAKTALRYAIGKE